MYIGENGFAVQKVKKNLNFQLYYASFGLKSCVQVKLGNLSKFQDFDIFFITIDLLIF